MSVADRLTQAAGDGKAGTGVQQRHAEAPAVLGGRLALHAGEAPERTAAWKDVRHRKRAKTQMLTSIMNANVATHPATKICEFSDNSKNTERDLIRVIFEGKHQKLLDQ